jgi:dienelactone hydrolase
MPTPIQTIYRRRGLLPPAASVIALALIVTALMRVAAAQPHAAPRVEKRAAPGHPMQYFVSPPDNWQPNRDWPVLVVITDAYRRFRDTAEVFATARGGAPFVIVTPLVLSGGGTAQQHMADFDYDQAAWERAATDGNCAFDAGGLTAVLADVRQRYHAEAKVFMTGWEAGGHVVLSQLLNEPERLRGVVVVTPNFQSRCVSDAPARHDPAAMAVPVRNLVGSNDTTAARGPLGGQWGAFENVARGRGFTDLKVMPLPGRGHGSLATDVFDVLTSWIR